MSNCIATWSSLARERSVLSMNRYREWEGEAPAEPRPREDVFTHTRLGRSLALPEEDVPDEQLAGLVANGLAFHFKDISQGDKQRLPSSIGQWTHRVSIRCFAPPIPIGYDPYAGIEVFPTCRFYGRSRPANRPFH